MASFITNTAFELLSMITSNEPFHRFLVLIRRTGREAEDPDPEDGEIVQPSFNIRHC